MNFGRKNKFKAVAVTIDGIRFASKKEAARYGALKLLEKAGEIRGLEIHPRFKIRVREEFICTYVGDFRYLNDFSGHSVVEDVKGYKKGSAYNLFKIKKALLFATTGIEVVEI